jgi:hypothetical protein
MELILYRRYFKTAVNGSLYSGEGKICDTIELPWRNNERQISCIPEGRYKIHRRFTGKFGWHCVVEDVPHRDGILIHAFNVAWRESRGCIGPVQQLEGEGIGKYSRAALVDLMETLDEAFDKNEPVWLTIKEQKDETDNPKGEGAHAEVLQDT